MTNLVPAVFLKDGVAYTSSRDVAALFEKRHKDVLEAADRLVSDAPEIGPNFRLSSYISDLGDGVHRSYRSLELTRDGFTLLAMGFTGSKALKFKIAYIARFNELELELRERDDEVEVIARTPQDQARLLVGEARRTFGHKAAQQLWGQLGLPTSPQMLVPPPQMEMSFVGSLFAANAA